MRGKLGVDECDVLVGGFDAGLDVGGGSVVLVKVDVELLDRVEEHQEIMVVGVRDEVPSNVLQAAMAAAVGRRRLVLCVGLVICAAAPQAFSEACLRSPCWNSVLACCSRW